MRFLTLIVLALSVAGHSVAQDSRVSWGAFTMGYSKSQLENITVHSVSGQTLVGLARESNIMITSGFLVDTLFRKVVVAIGSTESGVPGTYELAQNYPNPFNPSTMIHYEISAGSQVTLKVYNVLGQVVTTLINNEERTAGRYNVKFDAAGLSSGAYFYRLTAGSFVAVKKLLLLR